MRVKTVADMPQILHGLISGSDGLVLQRLCMRVPGMPNGGPTSLGVGMKEWGTCAALPWDHANAIKVVHWRSAMDPDA